MNPPDDAVPGVQEAPPRGDTKQRLRDAAIATVRDEGIAGVSARTVAGRAGCNQASIYYHFGSLDSLLAEASLLATEERVGAYRGRLASVTTLRELVALAHELHAEERELGNVAVLAQMLAGGQNDPALREPTAAALKLWVGEVERTLARILTGTPLDGAIDVHGFARTVSAAFVGMELMEGISSDDEPSPLDTLEQVVVLVETLLELGSVGGAALRWQMARSRRNSNATD
jgi:AcrR family transcriptional regulator